MDQKSIWINIVMLVLALIYFIIPPKKRNYFYGYRTFKSMKSDEDFSKINKKASQIFLLYISLATIANLVMIFIFNKTITQELMLGAIALIIITIQAYIIKKIP